MISEFHVVNWRYVIREIEAEQNGQTLIKTRQENWWNSLRVYVLKN